jgi:hypothetical protein
MKLKNEPNGAVAKSGQMIVGEGEYIHTVVEDPSVARALQGPEDVEQGGLAYSRGTKNGGAFLGRHGELQAAEDIDAALAAPKVLVDVPYLDKRLGAIHSG